MDKVKDLILALFDVGAVKFGSFTLKSGIQSPIYFDLRVIISHPKLMESIAEILEKEVEKMKVDIICGVPYTALPLATLVSVRKSIPMLIKRKEQKKYGTGKLIEGEYTEGKSTCLILEDVVTTGSSVAETATALREHGIQADQAIVILNRNYPAADENLSRSGVHLTSIVKVDHLLQVLLDASRISVELKEEVEKFLGEGQAIPEHMQSRPTTGHEDNTTSIVSRLEGHTKRLFEIIVAKQSNLCLSADCPSWQRILNVTEAVGSKICAVKTHIDAINFGDAQEISEFTRKLVALSKQHNFIIIEDRKFGDIGSTVEKQLTATPFSISTWAHFVTVHSIPGPGMLEVFKKQGTGVILIAEMSSAGNLPSLIPEYRTKTLELCNGYEDTVVGFVSQTRVGKSLGSSEEAHTGSKFFLQFTPGVSLQAAGDALGQQYVSVKDAVLQRDADVIIVGRGIIQQSSEKWMEVAEEYRKQGWEAFNTKLMMCEDAPM